MIDRQELETRQRARAERRRRRVARRRAGALAVIAAIAVVLVVVFLVPGGSHPRAAVPGAAGTTAASHPQTPARHVPAGRTLTARERRTLAVPILMYHVIEPAPPSAPFPALYVPRAEFAAQMRALDRAGYVAITMDQLWEAWWHHGTLPRGHPVIVSFDNGYRTQADDALPVLRRHHWVGVENIQLEGLPPSQGGLSRRDIRRLLDAGWELDTQGLTHADLITLGPAALQREVASSRQRLQQRWHRPVHWFCYPSGHYDAQVIAAVKAAGYRGATTVIPGWAHRSDDPYRLPRLRVVAGTSPSALLEQITAARNAVAAPASYG